MIFLTFFFILVPYVSPYPLSSDIQPVFSILSWLVLILSRKITFNSYELFFFFVSVIYMVAFSFIETDDLNTLLRKHLNLICLFPVLPVVRVYGGHLVSKLILPCTLFYLFGVLSQVIFPSFYNNVLSMFYNHKVIELGTRGWSGFMAEPTDLGFTAVMLIMVCLILKEKMFLSSAKFKIIVLLLTILAFGSVSGSGLIGLLIILFTYNFSTLFNRRYFLLSLLSVSALVFFLTVETDIRSINLFQGLIFNPWQIIEHTSFFYRILHNLIAFYWLIDSLGMPAGVGGMADVMPYIIEKYNLHELFPSRSGFLTYSVNHPSLAVKNALAQLIIELGLLGLLFAIITYLYILTAPASLRIRLTVMVAFSLFLFQSFPLIYTIPWVQISLLRANCHRSV